MDNIVTGTSGDNRIQLQKERQIPFTVAQAFTGASNFAQGEQDLAALEAAELAQQDPTAFRERPIVDVPDQDHSGILPELPATPVMPVNVMPQTPWNTGLPPQWQPAPDMDTWLGKDVETFKDQELQRLQHQPNLGHGFRAPDVPLTGYGTDAETRAFLQETYQQAGNTRRRSLLARPDPQTRSLGQPTDPRVPTSSSPFFEDSWASRMADRIQNAEPSWSIGGEITRFGRVIKETYRDIFRADDKNFNWELDDMGSVLRNLFVSPLAQGLIQRATAPDEKKRESAFSDTAPGTSQAIVDYLQYTEMGSPDLHVNPLRGTFGEYGRGVLPGALYYLSTPGQLAAASLYSVVDLGRYLVGGEEALYGDKEAYTQYGYRFLQALDGQDLGFTNFRDGRGNRYLAAIDPEASGWTQVAQGAVGFAGDLLTFGWVDDAVGDSLRVVRAGVTGADVTGAIEQARSLTRTQNTLIQRDPNTLIQAASEEVEPIQMIAAGEPPVASPTIPQVEGQPWIISEAPQPVEHAQNVAHFETALGQLEEKMDVLNRDMWRHRIELEQTPGLIRGHIADEIANREMHGVGTYEAAAIDIAPTQPGEVRSLIRGSNLVLEAPPGEFDAYGAQMLLRDKRLPANQRQALLGRLEAENPEAFATATNEQRLLQHPMLKQNPSGSYDFYRGERVMGTIHPGAADNGVTFDIDGATIKSQVENPIAPVKELGNLDTAWKDFIQHPQSRGLSFSNNPAGETLEERMTKFRAYQRAGFDVVEDAGQAVDPSEVERAYRGQYTEEDLANIANRRGTDVASVSADIVRSGSPIEYSMRMKVPGEPPSPDKLEETIWYHGTKGTDIVNIRPNVGSGANELGAGLYLTADPNLAKLYAQKATNPTQPFVGTRRVTERGRVFEAQLPEGRVLDANQFPTKSIRDTFRTAVRDTFDDILVSDAYVRRTRNGTIDKSWFALRQAWNDVYPNRPISELDYSAFSSRVASELVRKGYSYIDHVSPSLGATRVVLDPGTGRLPVTVRDVLEDIGDGSIDEARLAQVRADTLLHAHFNNEVTGAFLLGSQIAMEARLFEQLFDAWSRTLETGEVAVRELLDAEEVVHQTVLELRETRLAQLASEAPQSAVRELKSNNHLDIDSLCL